MWELDCEEGWAPMNWCFWTVVLEKTLESPLDCKEISPGCSLEGLMLKLKLQYFGHLMARVDSFEKTLMLGGIGGRRRRGQQMAGWHHWLYGYESEWTLGVGDGQGGLAFCDSWGRKESDTTERLNWTDYMLENFKIMLYISYTHMQLLMLSILTFSLLFKIFRSNTFLEYN